MVLTAWRWEFYKFERGLLDISVPQCVLYSISIFSTLCSEFPIPEKPVQYSLLAPPHKYNIFISFQCLIPAIVILVGVKTEGASTCALWLLLQMVWATAVLVTLATNLMLTNAPAQVSVVYNAHTHAQTSVLPTSQTTTPHVEKIRWRWDYNCCCGCHYHYYCCFIIMIYCIIVTTYYNFYNYCLCNQSFCS